LTESDRQFVLEELKASEAALLEAIAHLSAARARFKPDPARWSILECVEHVGLVEDAMREAVLRGTPGEPSAKSNPERDRYIAAASRDRSRTFSAPEVARPSGRFATIEDARQYFLASRERTRAFVEQCRENLREQWTLHPLLGRMDCHTCLVLLAAHPARHAAQIRELAQHPGFPQS
jgi:hypothetical protein